MRLLMVTPGRIASTQIFDLVFQGLADQGALTYRAVYDSDSTPDEQQDAIIDADVIFFLRSFTRQSLALLRFARRHGKMVVYSTDDDFNELDPETPLGRLHLEPQNRQAYESLIAEADLVWLYTEEMKRRYAPLAKRVAIGRLPSFVERNGPRDVRSPAGASDAILVVGYGGSSTHQSDLRVVVRPLLEVLDCHPHVRAQFVNYAPPELARHPHVEVRPFIGSLLSYYEFLQQARWSIALAPLEDTRFNRGKTSNKYREYAGLGIPGIYSRVPVYAECVRHGETGYLAGHDEESFAVALREMIEDSGLRSRIRIGALQDASSTYSLRGAQLHFLREISRLALEWRYLEWHRPRVLVVGYASTSSLHLGALQPCRALARDGLVEARHAEPDALVPQALDGCDAVVVMRAFEEQTLALLDWARARQVPLIAEWDDDFLEIPPGTPIGDYYRHPSVVRAIERYLRESSLVLASTPPLFARSAEYTDRLMETPYGLDAELLAGIAPEKSVRPPAGATRVGFLGSNDALAQTWMVEALLALKRRYGDAIAIEAIGLDPPPQLRPALSWWRAGVLPYEDALRLMRSRAWAIGLAPLADSVFNEAKQATKFRDYAWAGATAVCSRVPAYERSLLDGVHCLLAESSAEAWKEAVAALIDDPEMAETLRRGARRLLESVHLQELTNATWLQLLWRVGAARTARRSAAAARTQSDAQPDHAGRGADGAVGSDAAGGGAGGGRRRPRGDDTDVVELIGREPAQYVPLSRPRRYDIVPAHRALRGVEVCVGSADGAPRARLRAAICVPGGEVLREGTLDLVGVRSGTWARFDFPEIRNAQARRFVLRLRAEAEHHGEVGIFESTRFASRRTARVVRRLGFAPLVAAPFVRLVYSAEKLERTEGAPAGWPEAP